jgi:catechol 2,3-dioxygenase-like lactoylglutathione lyase family enzyme
MNLIVYYVKDIEESKGFYEALGLSFILEKHGKGPEHYSTSFGGLVFEIYPCVGDRKPSSIRLGFNVDGTCQYISKLDAEKYGQKAATLTDPNGNKVDVTW